MKCINCDNEAMENEVLCAECAAKERNINNEEQTETEKLTEEVKVEITSTEVENSEDNHVITEQDVPQAANSVPTYVPTASPAYDGFSMNQDAAPHEEKIKKKGYDPALVKKMQAQLKPLSTWGFFWREAICFIPIINLAFLFVCAFADGINLNSRAFARSKLIRYLIYTVILLAALVLYFIFQEEIMNVIHAVIDNLYKYIHY